jgi:chromosome partitioning protein
MTTVTFINQKGGVGKTTTAMLTAETITGFYGPKTLLIDFDPLGTLSDIMLERYDRRAEYTVTDWLTGTSPALGSWTRLGNGMYILPADNSLEEVLSEMSSNPGKVFDLRNMLKKYCTTDFDLVIIDAPPSLSALAWAAIIAADLVVMPTLPDKTSVKGAQNVMRQIDDLRAQLGMAPAMIGTIANMVNPRIAKHSEALQLLTAAGMPKMLGALPIRQGRKSWTELKIAFKPVANELVDAATPLAVSAATIPA